MIRALPFLLCVLLPLFAVVSPAEIMEPLIDPAKLDTLDGKRAANPRLRKIMFYLESSRVGGGDPGETITQAQRALGVSESPRGKAVKASLIRNLDILRKLGCLDIEGMEKLKRGNAPIVKNGPYAGEVASIDHIIPRSVADELDERLYNLEFMPASVNGKKGNKITQRQYALANEWAKAGLLSAAGLKAVRDAWRLQEQD